MNYEKKLGEMKISGGSEHVIAFLQDWKRIIQYQGRF